MILGVLVLVCVIGLPLYCIIDAATRSSDDFRAVDSNKTLWVVLPFVFGIIAAIAYLVAVRPKFKIPRQ
jgi:hypothetical protein